ncbi:MULTISPECIES: DUF6909 family protein [Spirosoma]|uniref:Uncharacterized protein n=1 Tax=Spirosoma liriopis TaxID=2937440 RepID=A0ABT0HMW2_9BACT|nr:MULTISPECIES: hypothetical protein [Spirosoma]MCK8493501.1 hypothetical protein [Spirosoma liriopis]UHG92879.1 hypothetical protein LQ777_08235 [Spirosoma oryzicola]
MDLLPSPPLTRAQESRVAIERLYITMRHLFNRGFYKPSGVSGEEIRRALLTLQPEIYGLVGDQQRVELDGLVYVMDRLPKGIESCRIISLASREGFEHSHFPVLVPAKRRRNCYRIDSEQMVIEVTNGRSEIYDILTHLTFMFMEADKIRRNAFQERGSKTREWEKLEAIIQSGGTVSDDERELALMYLSSILGRTFEDTQRAYQRFAENAGTNSGLFQIVYALGSVSVKESKESNTTREINFTPMLRERIGQHLYGERWATHIKQYIWEHNLQERPIHIISANPHSVMNCLYAPGALAEATSWDNLYDLALKLSQPAHRDLRKQVISYANEHGMHVLEDVAGTSLLVQLIDTAQVDTATLSPEITHDPELIKANQPLLLIMDYAFGEQAFETMDELLKPFERGDETFPMNVASISIIGKAGILTGEKGDLMIPTAHIFEGTADNYPLDNDFCKEDFEGHGIPVYEGAMITVLGTSLQNKNVLSYFKNSSWKAIGLEMEGAHYQKAIQAQSKIRDSVSTNVKVRYAYYASDNPLLTGATLASGSLGTLGVKPTYLITVKCLEKVLK